MLPKEYECNSKHSFGTALPSVSKTVTESVLPLDSMWTGFVPLVYAVRFEMVSLIVIVEGIPPQVGGGFSRIENEREDEAGKLFT